MKFRKKYIDILFKAANTIKRLRKEVKDDEEKYLILMIISMLWGICILFDKESPTYYRSWLMGVLIKNEEEFRKVMKLVNEK